MKTAWTALLTLTLLLPIAIPTQAMGPAKIGVKAGISIADEKFEFDNPEITLDPDTRTGLVIGLFMEKPLLEAFSVRGGATYVQKGSELSVPRIGEGNEILGTEKFQDRRTYISIEGLGKLNIPVGKTTTYALFGPRLDIKVKSESEFGVLDESDIKSTVFGLTFGLGQQFTVKSLGSIFVEANYYYDVGSSLDIEGLKITNKALAVMAGVSF